MIGRRFGRGRIRLLELRVHERRSERGWRRSGEERLFAGEEMVMYDVL